MPPDRSTIERLLTVLANTNLIRIASSLRADMIFGKKQGGSTVIAGTYSFVYCGANDVGMGQFIIGQDGGFAGADLGGVIYTGIARENDVGWITLDIQLTIPAGTTLVQGTAVQDVPHTNSIHAFLPPDFGDGHPQQIQAALGVVTIMVKRVPEGTAFPPAATPVHRIGEE